MDEQKKSSCEICRQSEAIGRYTCPKCNILYCSLACYRDEKKHLSCSELFYKDQVISELKLDDVKHREDREKMADILKRASKALILDDASFSDSDSESTDQIAANEEEQDEEVEPDLNELLRITTNKSLIRKAANLNISKANSHIYHDIIQLALEYAFLACLFDVNDETLVKAKKTRVSSEFTLSYLDIVRKKAFFPGCSVSTSKSLGRQIFSTMSLLTQQEGDKARAHQDFLNKSFFVELIDDLLTFNSRPSYYYIRIISFFYDQLETLISSDITASSSRTNEKPLNVFHMNGTTSRKPMSERQASGGSSRIQILSVTDKPTRERTTQSVQVDDKILSNECEQTSNDCVREAKLVQRKLQFLFKWLNVNKMYVESSETKDHIKTELAELKEQLANESNKFNEEKEFIEKNLNFIRSKQSTNSGKLIEEILPSA